MKNKKTRFLVQSSVIAALYVALTFVSSLLGLSSGVIQIRFSEALTVLPAFIPAAVPGLFVGCLLANLITGSIVLDTIFGSIATLLGAVSTYLLRKYKFLAPLPPIIANTLIIPFILAFAYGFQGSVWYFMLTVGIGEIISCGLLGYVLMLGLRRTPDLFK